MALGYDVNKNTIDMKAASAVLELRSAFRKIETMAQFLENHPNSGTDPLVAEFDYSTDEAYALRIFFETFNTVRADNAATFDIGRLMTGLE